MQDGGTVVLVELAEVGEAFSKSHARRVAFAVYATEGPARLPGGERRRLLVPQLPGYPDPEVIDQLDVELAGPGLLAPDNTTIGLSRWPSPHRSGHVIHATGGGRFAFDHLAPDAATGPEIIYTKTP